MAGPVIATGLLNFGMNQVPSFDSTAFLFDLTLFYSIYLICLLLYSLLAQVLLTSSSYLIDAVPAKSASAAGIFSSYLLIQFVSFSFIYFYIYSFSSSVSICSVYRVVYSRNSK